MILKQLFFCQIFIRLERMCKFLEWENRFQGSVKWYEKSAFEEPVNCQPVLRYLTVEAEFLWCQYILNSFVLLELVWGNLKQGLN